MAKEPHVEDKEFNALVGRIFTDAKFADALEKDPEKTLNSAGYKLAPHQLEAIRTAPHDDLSVLTSPDTALKIPTVRPVVSILTKGTRPVVSVVVRTVVASQEKTEDRKK